MRFKSSYVRRIVLISTLILLFSDLLLDIWIKAEYVEDKANPSIKMHQPIFTELIFGHEYFERNIILSEDTEDFYYYINVPEGNLKVEMTWMGLYSGLDVDLVVANDSNFTQIIASSLDNQERFVVTFDMEQARTIFIHVGITNEFLLILDFKLLVSRNLPPLNLSLIIFLVVIGNVCAGSIIIYYMKRKRT